VMGYVGEDPLGVVDGVSSVQEGLHLPSGDEVPEPRPDRETPKRLKLVVTQPARSRDPKNISSEAREEAVRIEATWSILARHFNHPPIHLDRALRFDVGHGVHWKPLDLVLYRTV
jgi:hypothetical protein